MSLSDPKWIPETASNWRTQLASHDSGIHNSVHLLFYLMRGVTESICFPCDA